MSGATPHPQLDGFISEMLPGRHKFNKGQRRIHAGDAVAVGTAEAPKLLEAKATDLPSI